MYTYIYIHHHLQLGYRICIYVYVQVCVCFHMYVHICVCIFHTNDSFDHPCPPLSTPTAFCVQDLYIHVRTCTCLYSYVCTYMCMYISKISFFWSSVPTTHMYIYVYVYLENNIFLIIILAHLCQHQLLLVYRTCVYTHIYSNVRTYMLLHICLCTSRCVFLLIILAPQFSALAANWEQELYAQKEWGQNVQWKMNHEQ